MSMIGGLRKEELTQVLAYTGLILVAYELVKSLIVRPIKFFYMDMTFSEGSPFKSYEEDVLFRHKNEFEACLLYLRDFMEAIDSDDVLTIQELRKHRNDLAHNIAHKLQSREIKSDLFLLERVNKTLFKLSNYRAYIEIGSDPEFKNKGIDWALLKGHEYLVFEEVLNKIRILQGRF
ncbi:MAG: hypothetical protein Q8N72_04295 [Candidatus Omnitrophota bacterium]|nr:hypothetical protein [Candidatus Omnitrophota bacterium]